VDWSPIIDASLPIKLHLATVLPAFVIGTWMISFSAKGAPLHRLFGFIYLALMSATAVASFFIRSSTGGFSLIHLFIPLTVWGVFTALWGVRTGNIKAHRNAMIGLYTGGILIAGVLTFLPGRRMHAVFFGG
jgi:uncharacterized membrane protein